MNPSTFSNLLAAKTCVSIGGTVDLPEKYTIPNQTISLRVEPSSTKKIPAGVNNI